MSPFNENIQQNENDSWSFDEKDYWQPVTRKSSFSDINQVALRNARNSSTTSGYVKEFRRYLMNEKRRIKTIERKKRYRNRRVLLLLSRICRFTLDRIKDDWLCLALLGIFMALLSVGVDKGIEMCLSARIWLYRDLTTSRCLSYICWIALPIILILFAVIFVKMLAPQSVGSGIPEVKTILRGFPVENHLTFKTLVAKLIGLVATLGSGIPLGKEAPFVHISCIVSRLLNKMMSSIRGTYPTDTHNTETLVAGCAVGIAACFASPIGGVLYSIEATSTYFAVKNYWRAFFAAVCTAVVFRLHAVWSDESETITALFATNFATEFPFDPQELFIFAIIGVICGFLSSLWVWFFRQYSIFVIKNRFVQKLNQQTHFLNSYLLYPFILVAVMSFLTYPFGFCHVAGHLSTHDQMTQLFSNFTWSQSNLTEREANIVANWTNGTNNFISTLIGYFIYTFLFSVIASTIAVPSGTFIPVLKLGACLGRLIGESIHLWFPSGVYFSARLSPVIPGGYAVVGCVAFAGAATHTISVAVMALEMTGQITLIAPIMISLLISNAIAVHLCPSIYDTIILLKKLPYLPELFPSKVEMHDVVVKNFMVKNVNCIWYGMTYGTLQTILMENEDLHHLPLVECRQSMILLGSVERNELIKIIARQISQEKRLQVAAQWQQEVQIRQHDETRASFTDSVETIDVIIPRTVVDNVPSVTWQEDGLKNRRPSRIEVTQLNDISILRRPSRIEVTTLNDVPIFPDIVGNDAPTIQNVDNHSPEVMNSETITSNSSGYAHLDNMKETAKLLKKSDSTVSKTNKQVIDMTLKDQKRWETLQLNQPIDFDFVDVNIDPSPFQRAYVTHFGILVGVVGLKELTSAIEDVNNGNFMIQIENSANAINDCNVSNSEIMEDIEKGL